MDRYLVTGAAGFIGSTICERLLNEGKSVRGIDCYTDYYPRELKEKNLSISRSSDSFEFIEADLNDVNLASLLEGITYIFHLAAQPGVRKSWGDNFQVYIDQNIRATQRLLEALAEKTIKKFVFASSSSVYGDTPVIPMKEDALVRPVSPYGVTKLAAENLVNLYNKAHGIPVVSLRLFTVYGPRQRPDMAFSKFMTNLLKGEPIEIYGDGEQTRDFTYVDDVVNAFVSAADKGKSGKIYNIGGGHRISINRLIEKLKKITGIPVKTIYISSQKGEMRHTYANYSSAGEELDYSPGYDLDEGLKNEWEWLHKMTIEGKE